MNPCTEMGCTTVTTGSSQLLRHMYIAHWPWKLRPFLCEYCKKGYYQKQKLLSHLSTDRHRDAMADIMRGERSKFVASTWRTTYLNECAQGGKMTAEHLQLLQSMNVTTTDSISYTVTVPSTHAIASTNDMNDDDQSVDDSSEEEDVESTAGAIINGQGQYTGYITQVSPPSGTQYSTSNLMTANQVPVFNNQYQPPNMTPGMIISGPPGTPNQIPSSSTPTFQWSPLPPPPSSDSSEHYNQKRRRADGDAYGDDAGRKIDEVLSRIEAIEHRLSRMEVQVQRQENNVANENSLTRTYMKEIVGVLRQDFVQNCRK